MYCWVSSIMLQGHVFFLGNHAEGWGGGMFLSSTSFVSEGQVNFTGRRVRVHFSFALRRVLIDNTALCRQQCEIWRRIRA